MVLRPDPDAKELKEPPRLDYDSHQSLYLLANSGADELAEAIFDHVVTSFGVPKEFLTNK
jgi:hypothetical protein